MTERKTYYLDLQTVLEFLHNKSGILSARIKIDGQWGNGRITIIQGQVGPSSIEWPTGQLDGERAFDLLSTIQEWQVSFENIPPATTMSPATFSSSGVHPAPPQSVSPSMPMRMPSVTPIVPRVRVELSPFMLVNYTPQQRTVLQMVYAMIDGHKNINQIKTQLNIPTHIVDSALIALQRLGTIDW